MTEEVQLLASDVLGRVKTPAAKREAILDEFERGGMTAMAFAEHIGVKYPTFATWVQKRKKERGQYSGDVGRKRVPEAGERDEPDVRDFEASVRRSARALSLVEAVVERASAGAPVRVKVGDGVEVVVTELGQVPLVVELVRALRAS